MLCVPDNYEQEIRARFAMPHFADRLMAAVVDKSSAVLVGLDPRRDRLPNALTPPSTSHEDTAASYRRFCHGVLDVVADLVAVVKPQAAFFEQLGPPGMLALADVIQYARQKDLLVVLDGKRNDIGSTAEAYADAYLGRVSAWQADALTVSPYLGDDSLTPFVEVACQRDAGVFVLVKTSNPGGKRWQDAESHGATIYEHVADYVEELALATQGDCGYGAVGAVVGATYPAELEQLRARMPHTLFLVPGFGSQGGTAKDVAAAFDQNGQGAIINSSRNIIFAHEREEYRSIGQQDWQRAVEQATRDMIAELRDVIVGL